MPIMKMPKIALVSLFVLASLHCGQSQRAGIDHTGGLGDHALGAAAGVRPPIIPSSWTVAAWDIDPANASTCASDTNNCTQSSCGSAGAHQGPCATFAEIAARWGTYSPRLQQATTITYLSSQTAAGDPVYLRPIIESGGSFTLQGTSAAPALITTGTLGTTVAKVRTTSTQLNTTLNASSAANQLIVNSTHPSSAWAQASTGSNTFAMTQPLLLTTPASPTEVDTWASTDAFSALAPVAVDLVEVLPIVEQPVLPPPVTITNITVTDFGSITNSADAVTINGAVTVSSVGFTKRVLAGTGTAQQGVTFSNCDFRSGGATYITGPGPQYQGTGNTPSPVGTGGSISTSNQVASVFGGVFQAGNNPGYTLNNVWMDFDVVLAAATTSTGIDFYGCVEGLTGIRWSGASAYMLPTTLGACSTNAIAWGPTGFGISANGTTRWSYSGATATNTFVGGPPTLRTSTSTTACCSTNANPDVVVCGIVINVTNLDAAGCAAASNNFAGTAFFPGGSSFVSVP
jgi:hypothetical protein